MALISINVDATRAAKALERLAHAAERYLAALGIPLMADAPPPEPKTADALADEVQYDTDEDRKRRELEAMLRGAGRAEPEDIDEAAQEPI